MMANIKWLDHDEAEITVSWRRWFGLAVPEIVTYRGSGTVWRDAATGKRQPTHIEMKLSDMWTKARWDRYQTPAAASVTGSAAAISHRDDNRTAVVDRQVEQPTPEPEAPAKTMVYVRAAGTPSDDEDEDVAGFYMVEVDGDVPAEHIGSAALDIFHSDVAVEVLDDFDFTVYDMDGKIVQISDSEGYEFTDRGTAYTIPDPEGVTFEQWPDDEQPAPTVG